MDKDLFFEILENNTRLNEYYLEDIEFFQNLIDFMEDNSYEILNIKRLKEFIEENL